MNLSPEAARDKDSRTPASQKAQRRGDPTPFELLHHDRDAPEARAVDMRPLKAAVQGLKPSHPARAVIMAEPDTLSSEEYAAKAVVWFRLLRLAEG